ncbi:MAG: protein kinase [Gemmataceae bacterium]
MGRSSARNVITLRMKRPQTFAEAKAQVASRCPPVVRGYEIFEEVGAGGMGVVYRARQRDLNRIVALKMLRSSAMGDAESRERFRAEAEAVARLQHPNIIQVFEIGQFEPANGAEASAPFIALEYVDGGNLTSLAAAPQPARMAAELVEKLARAVHSAHELGVVHRDLKPANVLLTRNGEPKIADFGLAKQLETELDGAGRFVTQAGIAVGTPEYMPPEQTAGKPATPAIDIYALGVILYELMTARVPFRGATPYETMAIAQDADPVSPRRLQPVLPRDLETICLKCLEKSPARRYASAAALAADLRAFLDGRTIQARRAGNSEKVVRWCRRNPFPAALVVATAATILLAFALVSRSNVRLKESLEEEATQRHIAQESARAERFEGYRAHLSAAASLFDSFDIGAKSNLNACPEEYRHHWEWRHFKSRFDVAERVIPPPAGGPFHCHLLADGSRVVLSTRTRICMLDVKSGNWVEKPRPTPTGNHPIFADDGIRYAAHCDPELVELWNLESDRVVRFPKANESKDMRFTADRKRLLTGAPGRTVRLRDSETGSPLMEFTPYPAGVHSAWLSPDGRRIVTHRRKPVRVDLWNADGTHVAELPCGETGLNHVYFGKTRFIIEEHFPQTTLKLCDLESGRFLKEMPGHGNSVLSVAFAPDESRIVTASMDQHARLWLGDGTLHAIMAGHKGWVNVAAFSPDGERIVTASQDHTLRLWDGRSGKLVNVLCGHDEELVRAAYTADGSKIVTVSSDAATRVWDSQRSELGGVLKGHGTFAYSVSLGADGRRAASGSWDGTARIWSLEDERELARFDHPAMSVVLSVALHPDGRLLATRTREAVHLWDLESKREVHRWDSPSDVYRHTRLAFSPDGRFLASAGTRNEVLVWDVATRALYACLTGHGDVVRDVAFTPDSRRLASAGEVGDPTIRIWNLSEKREERVLAGHDSAVYSLAFNRDGSLLASGSMDDTARIWNTADWSNIVALRHGTHVYGIAFSPDGKRLATACSNNAIRIWDTAKWKETVDLRGHTQYVHGVAFTPDGRTLVSASGDGTLRIWGSDPP